MRNLIFSALALAAAFYFWRWQNAPAPAAPSATTAAVSAPSPAVSVPAATSTAPAKPPPAPNPKELNPVAQVIQGVVYDLVTGKPVSGASVLIDGGGNLMLTTQADGWYRARFPKGAFAKGMTVAVTALNYRPGALLERDPPLASRTLAQRRAVVEQADFPLKPIAARVGPDVPLIQLNAVVVPNVWPESAPPAEYADANSPPAPSLPADDQCRVYGVVYDALTKKPMRRLALTLAGYSPPGGMGQQPPPPQPVTDGLGRYAFDVPSSALAANLTLIANVPGYRPGLKVDYDPPVREFDEKRRRELISTWDLEFEPAALPQVDCDEGLLRLDLLAVPKN